MAHSPFRDNWIECLKEGFRLSLRNESPRNIQSRLDILKKKIIEEVWIADTISDAFLEQYPSDEWITDIPERFYHSIECDCEQCKPKSTGGLVGGKEEPEGKKKGKKKKQEDEVINPHSDKSTFRERMLYLNTFLPDDYQIFRRVALERGDLTFIKPPYFVVNETERDIWIGDKGLYSEKRSIFAEREGESVTDYRRRIAGIPYLERYLKAFSGKIIGHEPGSAAYQIQLLWNLWSENGYLQCQNRSDIADMNFPLGQWILNLWIHSWQTLAVE